MEEKLSILEDISAVSAEHAGCVNRKATSYNRRPTSFSRRAISHALLLLMATLLASGCTSLKNANTGSVEPSSSPVLRQTIDSAGQPADNTIRHDTSNARVAQLWAEAELSRLSGDSFEASRYILQAIEVEPTDSVLLSRAAELQLQMGQPTLAESYAVRSNVLSESNRSLMLRNWMIIEHSREVRGDLLGVRTAHRMVQQFRN